ncbi:MAG TPA: hypothetical protein VF898_05580 [Chloroflexota bacterium]
MKGATHEVTPDAAMQREHPIKRLDTPREIRPDAGIESGTAYRLTSATNEAQAGR